MPRSIASFILLFLMFVVVSAIRSDDQVAIIQACTSCHPEQYTEATTSPYKHTIAAQRCDLCHILLSSDEIPFGEFTGPQGQTGTSFGLNGLTGEFYKLEVTATDISGRHSTATESVSPADITDIRANDGVGPAITGVHAAKVASSGFVSAVLAWKTGEDAFSWLKYGDTAAYSYTNTPSSLHVLTKDHKMTIGGLSANRTYHYKVFARDLFGNETSTGDLTLSTSNYFDNDPPPADNGAAPVVESVSFFKAAGQDSVYASVLTDKPSAASVKVSETVKLTEHGYGFLDPYEETISICARCHPQTVSHPVGVRATNPGVVIPEDLPTIGGGMMTCVTCHMPHGGQYEYLTRFKFDKDICEKCHITGIGTL